MSGGDPAVAADPAALREAMERLLRAGPPETTPALHALLRLLAPASLPVPVLSVSDTGAPQLAIEQRPMGEVRFFAYTDEQRVAASGAPLQARIAIRTLAATVLREPGGTLIIDAGDPLAVQLRRPELAMLAEGTVPDASGEARTRADGRIRIFAADSAVAAWTGEAMAAAAAAAPSVRSVVLIDAAFDDGPRHPVLVVDAVDPEGLDAIVAAARSAWPAGAMVDVIPAAPGLRDAVQAAGIVLHPGGTSATSAPPSEGR